MKSKLNEVLSEGLLDSVLPYLVPANASQRKLSQTKLTEKSSSHAVASNEKLGRRKSSDTTATTRTSLTKIEYEALLYIFLLIKPVSIAVQISKYMSAMKLGTLRKISCVINACWWNKWVILLKLPPDNV